MLLSSALPRVRVVSGSCHYHRLHIRPQAASVQSRLASSQYVAVAAVVSVAAGQVVKSRSVCCSRSPRLDGEDSSMPGDDTEDMEVELKSWTLRIKRSIDKSRRIKGGNYVQVATVDADGKPHCRTVVHRGFLESAGKPGEQAFKIITDSRSQKVQHGLNSAACELVWWFSQSSEQYRFESTMQLVGPTEEGELQAARQEQWTKLSDPAREQFFWDKPGVPYTGAPSVPKGGRGEDGEVLPPPDVFLLVLLWPSRVKYLRLSDNYAQDEEFDNAGMRWKPTRVNP